MSETTHLTCPECGSAMELRPSRYGKFYGCVRYPNCKATHGAHPNGSPLGTPADKVTKGWRIKAHDEFDKLWKSNLGGTMRRKDAYRLMREIMCMSPDEAHIGKFNRLQCETLIQRLQGRALEATR